MEIKLLLKEKDRRIVVDNFRTGTLLAQGGAPRGPKGDQGVGVTSVELISVAGVNKTYRMHFSDSSYFDFVVKDGTGALWGNIEGELANQSDLVSALNSKANVADLAAAFDSLELKQPKTLSESITISGTVVTTVEGALNALNNRVAKAVGEIFFSQSKNAADNPGSLPLFTGETISNADEVYPQFYAWVASHSELQISAADYTTAISTYGECPKYVIDTTNKTIKLPLLKNYIKMANTTDGITQASAGLPNITGKIVYNCGDPDTAGQGALYTSDQSTNSWWYAADSVARSNSINLDASRVSSVYGNSNTVTPTHTTLYPWVYAYNSAVPASIAQAAEFQAALTGKADTNLSNVTGTSGLRKLVETYQNGTFWYKVFAEYNPTTGAFIGNWCEQGGISSEIPTTGGATVTLLKEMANTNYWIGGGVADVSDGNFGGVFAHTKTTTSFVIDFGDPYSHGSAYWEVKGYLPSGD